MMILMMLSALAAPGDGKTMAMDDWQQMTVLAVAAADAPTGTHHVRVALGDLDGDGVADEAILALDCAADGSLTAARYIIAPRDRSSGMASGRREGKQKMWSPASFRLQQIKPTYDIKTMKGNERGVRGWDPEKKELVVGDDAGWAPITLRGTEDLCPATSEVARRATKSRSNIQNN